MANGVYRHLPAAPSRSLERKVRDPLGPASPAEESAADAGPLSLPAQSPAESVTRRRVVCDWQENFARATAGRAARWAVVDTGAWGRAEVPGDQIWIAPRTPCDKVYSVAVHEWTHHMQGVVYGDWSTVLRELAPYGGPEIVADCGALALGATWIQYGCPPGPAVAAATSILRGDRPA